MYSMAMGHLFRSVRLAGVLSEKGVNCLFVMKDYPEGVEYVTNSGFKVNLMAPDISEAEEVLYVVPLARQLGALLYIDIRFSIKRLIEAANEGNIPTVVYEDVCDENIQPSVLINPSLLAQNKEGYAGRGNTELLLGTDYLVLDPIIENYASSAFSSKIKNLFLCFGGADSCNISNSVLKILLKKGGDYLITLILGPAFKFHSDIKETIKLMDFSKRVKVISNCRELYSILSRANAAITAGGTIAYESVSLNIPTLVLPSIDYEARNMSPLIDAGFIDGIKEDIAYVEDGILEKKIDCFIGDACLRKKLFDKSFSKKLSGGIYKVIEKICEVQRLHEIASN